jgi:ElaB/YqjD/DUF883 family membrane-anchored ribosome-binding protein
MSDAPSTVSNVAEAPAEDALESINESWRAASDALVGKIDESVKQRPYTTLALAVGIGLLLGATWRR